MANDAVAGGGLAWQVLRGKLLAAAWAAHKAPEDGERDDQVPAAAPSTGMEKTKSQKKRNKKKQKKQ